MAQDAGPGPGVGASAATGTAVGPVHDARDLQHSPQYVYREFFAEVNHPVLGRAAYPTVPYKLSITPARIATPAPLLGQHTEEKLAALLDAMSAAARTVRARQEHRS